MRDQTEAALLVAVRYVCVHASHHPATSGAQRTQSDPADARIQALAKETMAAPELAEQIAFQMRLLLARHDLLTTPYGT